LKNLSQKRPKTRMHFDKTSPKKRNPQQQKISRNATKKPAQLCGRTVRQATLLGSSHAAKKKRNSAIITKQ